MTDGLIVFLASSDLPLVFAELAILALLAEASWLRLVVWRRFRHGPIAGIGS
jgi:hypothetical protein